MKNIYKIIIGLVILTPTLVFGARGATVLVEQKLGAIAPTGINQGNGFINPIRIGDRIEASSFIASSTSASSLFYGLVGIGTSTPVVPLDILSTTGSALSVTGGIGGTTIAQFSRRGGAVADIIMNGSGGDPQIVYSVSNTSLFSTGVDNTQYKISGSGVLGTNDIVTVSTAGNVGIGSSTPSSPLSMIGNFYQRGGYTHFGTADSGFACRTFSTSCIELVGDDNTAGGVILQVENKNTGASAYSGINLLNNEASLGNNASYYSGMFLNGSNYSDTTFGNLNNVPRILQLGNTMGSITIQASSTNTTPPYVQLALNNLEMARFTPTGAGFGTTTPRWPVQAAATTSPQLVLTSNGTTESHWGFRNAGGYMYITTINPVTFATSTNPNLSLSPLSSVVAVGTSTFPAGVQLAIAAGSNPVPVMYDSINSTGMYNIYRNSSIDMGYIGSAASLFPSSGGLKTDFAIRGSANLTFGVGPGEDMRIIGNGFVGVGTTSPYARLSVVGETVASHFTATSTTATSTFAGGVGIGTNSASQKLEVNGGIRLNTADSKPTCSVSVRGTFWAVQSAGGVKDTVEVCAKDAGDAYAWRVIY